ncbi:MAG: tRNA dihydrouridine synthase DusB [Prolixibacteraceae bacterium]|jgi:tRNA-dihydrouridine synthase B|nr:tRNA dihydrouridine synthase DusB [Prolixibacteraceae bacterium]MBT6766757.1 tRNA dihydrouridine synthase DusB [Prolixibacteraceae bacterium]MBT6998859.1 tRNA dihydrouridine synthase DusB [Prolixibacteraceae bacterium]MBT7394196.1 tRNA dihydrouridine synthase DusB [Prolixibacteraceae bacterium]
MRIGNIELKGTPLFLAPMEDVTYKSFRWMCKKYGADVMYTEFVSSEALVRDIEKTKQKMNLFDFDRPVAIQIYGHNINSMVRAAQVAEEAEPDFIDINFGCPMKKIVRHGAGAAMLKDLPKMQEMAAEIVKAVSLPVTAKTRLGWTESDKPIVEAAERLQDAGITALAIHGRTREQLYTGKADWTLIAEVKNNPKISIPIIGNGDINSAEKAKQFLDETGVDALMLGRGAIGRPWLFKEIKHFLETGELIPFPTVTEVVDVLREQIRLNLEWRDNERVGILMLRRHFAKYFPGLSNFRDLKIKLLRADTSDEVHEILAKIVTVYGDYQLDYSNASLR